MLDSGAFTDVRKGRLEIPEALERQLAWERKAGVKWGAPFVSEAVVSYDQLIDEKLTEGKRKKERWGLREADSAVRVTVDAAAYLASRRRELAPRKLVLACQGVDHLQYEDCASAVLAHAEPGDILGLGGWCILGLHRTWLPTFFATLRRVLPMAAARGLSRVHVFGVMWEPALGGLLWLADRHGLAVSTDSSKAAKDCTYPDPFKAGARAARWEDNVAWWRSALANLRESEHYREPGGQHVRRQELLFP